MPLLLVAADAGGVLVHQLAKDEPLEHPKHQHGQQHIHHRPVGRIGQQANA